VKEDIRSSRPAGTPFFHEGELIRPAQDCSKTYGGRIVLNRVTRLTPTKFEEQQVAVVDPLTDSPYPNGIHTLSAVGNFTMLDAKRLVFDRNAFKHAFATNAKKLCVSMTHEILDI
jgi:hypothetical protein